jgi:hypothetical protein
MTTSLKISRKMMMILAITTGGFLLSVIISTPLLSVNAINPKNIVGKTIVNNGPSFNGNHSNNIPQINGTIGIKNYINKSAVENVSIPFLTAAQTAQKVITNGTILNGHIGITQGFLTYIFGISNPTNGTLYIVIVDAGNGKVLYTSPGISITSFPLGMNGFGHGYFGHGYFGHGYFGHGYFGHGYFGPTRGW